MQKSLLTAETAPTIAALQEHLETVRQTELERVRRRQVSFLPEQQDALEELTRGIVARILHGPVEVLEAVSDDKAPALLSMVHRIFNLGDEPVGSQHQHRKGR
jgi:glutamyl-tRNA reductase